MTGPPHQQQVSDAPPAAGEILADFEQKIAANPKVTLLALEDKAVIEALAEMYDHSRTEFLRCMARWRLKSAPIRDIENLKQVVRANAKVRDRPLLHVVSADEAGEPKRVADILPDAPTSEKLIVPSGWQLDADGVHHHSVSGREMALPTPLFISRRFKYPEDGHEAVELVWHRDGAWQRHVLDRAVVSGRRKITELSALGLPVTSNTSTILVRYIAEFEAANLLFLPVFEITQHLGWQGENEEHSFLCGDTILPPDGEVVGAVSPPQQRDRFKRLYFRGKDEGEEQLARGFHPSGSSEEWLKAASIVSNCPIPQIAAYVSLSAAMLRVIRTVPNFVADLCNGSSTGKTTSLRLAASIWGNPDEYAVATALHTWDASAAAIECSLQNLNGLPFILDDTKLASDPKVVAQTIYKVASGQSRLRGTVRGLFPSSRFRTVLISSGEVPATSFGDGGTHARTLTLLGPPFGSVNEETALSVDRVNQIVKSNYGHMGPSFVQFLIKHRHRWTAWREEYQQREAAFVQRTQGDPVLIKLAKFVALLDVTAWLAEGALGLPWKYEDAVEELWNQVVRGAREADTARRALEFAFGWANSNEQAFYGRHRTIKGESIAPPIGWAGSWVRGTWKVIGFFPVRLREELKRAGYHPSILRAWRDRGWLDTDADKRLTKKTKFKSEPVRLILIRRDALKELDLD